MKKEIKGFLIILFLLLFLFAANLFWGAVDIPADAVRQILTQGECPRASWTFIVLQNRLPQACTALLSGAALSVSGLILQTCFRNPLADPSILGIDSGASLGVAIAILFLGGSFSTSLLSASGYALLIVMAICGSMAVMSLLLLFSSLLKQHVMLLITGIMISYLSSSVISLLNYHATAEGAFSFMIWGMGNFSSVSRTQLPLFSALILAGLAGAFLLIKPLNALLLGDRYAANLGIPIKRTRNQLLWITGLLTATSTAFCGPIAFIGLAVPHLVRMLLQKSQHQHLLPATCLLGGALCLLCNLLCNLPGQSGNLPLNAITPLLGAPMVLYIILKKQNHFS